MLTAPGGARISLDAGSFQNNHILKAIFSDVEINFTPTTIDKVTSIEIDQLVPGNLKSSNNLAVEIKQLLIDITNLDALSFLQWSKDNIGNKVDESKLDQRMNRFKDAFHYMFPVKKFHTVETVNNAKQVQFIENGKIITIEDLSSGEKQIVFRGSFLLRNKGTNLGAVVLIDEPEISLHPGWQLKILNFYKKLFTDTNGKQSSQLFFATHSPFIIHNGNRYNDKIIVLEKDRHGKTTFKYDHAHFYGWSGEKIIQNALKVETIQALQKNVMFVEGETDEMYFQKVIELFNHQHSNVDVRWIGRMNDSGQAEFTGVSALNQTRALFLANTELLQVKVVLLYDNDTTVQEKVSGNLFIQKAPNNGQNKIYHIGIENLLVLPDGFDKDQFYDTNETTGKYSEKKNIQSLNKKRLCVWILSLPSETLQSILSLVNDLYVKICNDLGNEPS